MSEQHPTYRHYMLFYGETCTADNTVIDIEMVSRDSDEFEWIELYKDVYLSALGAWLTDYDSCALILGTFKDTTKWLDTLQSYIDSAFDNRQSYEEVMKTICDIYTYVDDNVAQFAKLYDLNVSIENR